MRKGSLIQNIEKYVVRPQSGLGGADNVIEYSKEDIEPGFIEKNRSIMSNPRGFGLWLWKPYFIQKTLKSMKDGDWLFYVDGCTIFINDI